MSLGQKFLTQVRLGQFFVAWVELGQPFMIGFEFGKFPLKMSKFFRSGQKVPGSKVGRPLIYCGSKVSSGQVRAHLYSGNTDLWQLVTD